MSPAKMIVTISRDPVLQASRTLLLEHAGYAVTALSSDLSVHTFLGGSSQPALSLVLMCHSVPEKSRVLLCKAIKGRYPRLPILMLYNGYDPTAALVDGRIENMHDPESLVRVLDMLMHPKTGSASAGE
jgi:CheY-like chemotaxis protein